MAMELARQMAGRIWCDKRIEDREMDSELAEVIAEKFEELSLQPNLGCATTGQLIGELSARAELGGYNSYRTIDD